MQTFLIDLDETDPKELCYPTNKKIVKQWEEWANECADIMRHCITRQFIKASDDDAKNPLRLSQLGKPAMELVARKFYPGRLINTTVSENVRRTFFIGDTFEAYILFTLKRLGKFGYTVVEYQPSVTWEGLLGHPDLIVESPDGKQYVVDIKTTNDRYFNSLLDHGLDDERGYLTQLATYSEALGLDPILLGFNKNSSELLLCFPTAEEVKTHCDRARKVIKRIHKCNKFEDAFDYFLPPPPEPEKIWIESKQINPNTNKPRKKQVRSGKFVLPFSMKWSKYADLFYVLDSESYVLDYNFPQGKLHLKPRLE